MKPTLNLLTTLLALLLAPLANAADTPATKSAPTVAEEFAPIVDDAKLPRVLIIGDSVSVAYTLDVRKNLTGVANVHRIAANGGSTRTALGEYGLVRWLKPGEKWDVIHFNEGLHDLSYRFPDDRDKNDKGEYASPTNGGRPNVSLEQYEKNLRLIVARLKQTGAKLIFASTTPVPEADAAKYVKDSELPYNVVAKKIMAEEGVTWNDLWAAVKPKQDQLQGKRNVHFMAAGSAVLAKKVAEAITRELPQPTSK
jgi:acyl-CoA thioesterase-1